jgi:branched-subunit amino acid ABC-type transport system permease component
VKTFTFLLLGFGAGSVYGAIAMGVVMVRRATGVVNIAQGAMAMIPALVFVELRDRGRLVLPLLIVPSEFKVGRHGTLFAALVAIAVGLVIAAVLHVAVFNPIRNRPPVTKVVASIGVMIVLQTIGVIRFGLQGRNTKPIFPDDIVTIFGQRVLQDRLWLAGLVLVQAMALWAVFKYTNFGRSTVASEESEKGAMLIGLSPPRLALGNWLIASVVTSVFGILVTPIAGVSPLTYAGFIVPSLAAALAGRLKSLPIAVLVGLAMGAFQTLSLKLLIDQRLPSIVSGGFDTAVPFAVLVIALFFVGKKLPQRGAILEVRHPYAPLPQLGWRAVAVGSGALGLAVLGTSSMRLALVQSLVTGLLVLSVVVLTGLVGQVSLAQMALAGVGAFACSGLVSELGVPFPLGPLIAIAGTTLVGTLVALPAIRIRGVQLTVVTLAFGYALEQLLFRNAWLIGSDGMSQVPPPRLFGQEVGIISGSGTYPRRTFVVGLLVVTTVVFIMMANVRRGVTGRRLLAVRANERAAASAGIEVAQAKLIANTLGSFVAAVAGTVLAYVYVSFSSQGFEAAVGLQILALAYLGGVGSIGGAVIGGALAPSGVVYHFLNTGKNSANVQYVINGLGLIVVAVAFPGGLIEVGARLKRWWRNTAGSSASDEPTHGEYADGEIELIAID